MKTTNTQSVKQAASNTLKTRIVASKKTYKRKSKYFTNYLNN